MPIYPTSVWACNSSEEAFAILNGTLDGYVYQRDGHPNADVFAEKCAQLHEAERVAVTSSGMAAMALAVLSQLQQGDHLIASKFLYGRSLQLLTSETRRYGVESSVVDTTDLEQVRQAIRKNTRMIAVETMANPRLQVADIAGLASIADAAEARLLVDNTFATPLICQPLTQGAHLVVESVSKIMNGHADVM